MFFKKSIIEEITPYQGEIEEAKKTPNGNVFRIAGIFSENEDIPPEAIVGAWSVNEKGQIYGGFKKNPNYAPSVYPQNM